MEFDHVVWTVKDGIGFVTLNRPRVLNAINTGLLNDLSSAMELAESDPEVRVVVIRGAGRAFSAGADVKETSTLVGEAAEAFIHRGYRIFDRIARCPKPVIASIHGYALGGGLELALSCDLRIASEHAQLGLPEIKLGTLPGWAGPQRLVRLVGLAKAQELMWTGEPVDGREAARIGLVNRVVPEGELETATAALAGLIAQRNPVAVRFIKAIVSDHTFIDTGRHAVVAGLMSDACHRTPFFQKGTSKFLNKGHSS